MRLLKSTFFFLALIISLHGVHASGIPSPYLEDLTWTEVRERLNAGSTTILIPIGGTEQNGPHMVLGKHNVRVRALAGKIAHILGNALVAPVVAYVPEGSITPPAAHMRFTGTISISDAAFESMLESTARSFKQHGFKDVFFLGDHGGYQKNQDKVAQRLNHEWSKDPQCRVHALLTYYQTTQTQYVAALRSKGFSDYEIGLHAGLADTSLSLAIDPNLVREHAIKQTADTANAARSDGIFGNPSRSSAYLGQIGVDLIVKASVDAIQSQVREHSQLMASKK